MRLVPLLRTSEKHTGEFWRLRVPGLPFKELGYTDRG